MDFFNCFNLFDHLEDGNIKIFCDQVSGSTFTIFFILCIILCLLSSLSSSLLVMLRQQQTRSYKPREEFRNYPGYTKHN